VATLNTHKSVHQEELNPNCSHLESVTVIIEPACLFKMPTVARHNHTRSQTTGHEALIR